MPDNSLKWSQKKTTDSNGLLHFDLKGLGSGSKYVLTASPYGIKISSKDITETGDFKIQAGAVEVTLRRKDNGTHMPDQTLYLYEKVAPGIIQWRASSTTDKSGKVYFDPIGIDSGKVFLIKGKNLFGNNQHYYSPWIINKGKTDYLVSPDDPHKLDEEAPSFDQFHPSNNSILASKGFKLTIQVSDNNTVKNVALRIIDPSKGTTSGLATLSNNEWTFSVTAEMISKDQTVTVEAKASDQSGNISSASYQYSIIEDTEQPKLIITSHQSGDQIDEHGFFITGIVTDNTGYVNLLATVIDPIKGTIIDHKELEIGKNHHWALVAKDLSRDQDIIVKLDSIDSAGNINNEQLFLSVMTENNSMIQLINRITYGATPELIRELRDFGAESFIQQQLHPELIDDSIFEKKLNQLLTDESNAFQRLHKSQIAHAVYSKRQLQEVMTQFWENHFNTDLGKVNSVTFEDQENNLFRTNSLGIYRDLLQISATSPAMLKYLDNMFNYKDQPNENYARELMELHTLGVDGGYTSKDIAEVARAFTGWGIQNGNFHFRYWNHDDEEKIVLGTVLPSGSGSTEGEIILDLLAEHPSTARFICTKLLNTFVSDTPDTDTVDNCTAKFLENSHNKNQIALVLEGIFNSLAFSDNLNFHHKVKTPFEFIVGFYRNLPVEVNYPKTRTYLSGMGMPLFYSALPTGWPEKSNHLINSNQLLLRWELTNKTLFNQPVHWKNHILEPHSYLIDKGIETTEAVLGYLFETTLSHHYSTLEWNEALSILTNQQTEKFDIYATNAEIKIRNVIALMLQYPTYQLQ